MSMAGRNYSDKDIKILISLAADQCEYDGCTLNLVQYDKFQGDIAHIAGLNEGSMRYVEEMTNKERNAKENLMVLCKTHHGIIDSEEIEHTREKLLKMKEAHEKRTQENGTATEPSDKVVEEAILTIEAIQANTNTGNGTQLNQQFNQNVHQQNIYNNPEQLTESIKLIRRNVRLTTEQVRRQLRSTNKPAGSLVGAIYNNIVVDGLYSSLEEDDVELFKACFAEFRRISEYCINEDVNQIKPDDNDVYANLLEAIVRYTYEVGAYCVDNQKFEAVRIMSLATTAQSMRYTANWLYNVSALVYAKRGYQRGGLFQDAEKFVKESIALRMGWTEDEVLRNMTGFEFLGNIYQLLSEKPQDFALHAQFYEQSELEKLLQRIITDSDAKERAFPGVSEQQLAEAFAEIDRKAGQNGFRGGYSGGYWSDGVVANFIKSNTMSAVIEVE